MKENARKLLAKVGITRSFPNGKRSVNAGIHAIFLDSAVFTVSENAGKRPQKAGFHSLTAVNSRFSRLKTQGKCRNTRRSTGVSNRSVNVSKRMFTGVHWIGKLMDNGTNTRINRSENVWKTKDFPLGESQKMRVNCAFFVNSPRVFSVGKCHFFCRKREVRPAFLCEFVKKVALVYIRYVCRFRLYSPFAHLLVYSHR